MELKIYTLIEYFMDQNLFLQSIPNYFYNMQQSNQKKIVVGVPKRYENKSQQICAH